MRVAVNYIAYTAHTQACGEWTENESFTMDNRTPKNFGCSIQQNIAAMVADPRDLLGPGPMGPVDTARRATVTARVTNSARGAVSRTQSSSSDQRAGARSVAPTTNRHGVPARRCRSRAPVASLT